MKKGASWTYDTPSFPTPKALGIREIIKVRATPDRPTSLKTINDECFHSHTTSPFLFFLMNLSLTIFYPVKRNDMKVCVL